MLKVIACGDSNLFIINKNSIKSSYPFNSLDSLDENNFFINTETVKNNGIDINFFKVTQIELQQKDKILLASDALSRLILIKNNVIKELFTISNFEEMLSFCNKYWYTNELQEDDITAIIIDPTKIENHIKIIPPLNFEFPKIEMPEFIPNPLLRNNQLDFTDMQMEEIKKQFNGVANDFHYVKQGLRTNKLLMFLIIFLLSCNLIFIYLYRPRVIRPEPRTEKVKILRSKKNSNSTKKVRKNQNVDTVKSNK